MRKIIRVESIGIGSEENWTEALLNAFRIVDSNLSSLKNLGVVTKITEQEFWSRFWISSVVTFVYVHRI